MKIGRKYQCECTGECGLGHILVHDEYLDKGVCGSVPVGEQSRSNTLDVNHINKDILDNDPANLQWCCRTCHRAIDRQTDKGVSRLGDEYGY